MSDLDQTIHTLLQKALLPTGDGWGRRIEPLLDDPRRHALSQHKIQPSPEHIACWKSTRLLARLSDDGVRRLYQIAQEECCLKGERLPPAKGVQQLIQAWKHK